MAVLRLLGCFGGFADFGAFDMGDDFGVLGDCVDINILPFDIFHELLACFLQHDCVKRATFQGSSSRHFSSAVRVFISPFYHRRVKN